MVYPTKARGLPRAIETALRASSGQGLFKVTLDYYLSISYKDVSTNQAAVAVARDQCRFSQCKKPPSKPARIDYRTTGNSRSGACDACTPQGHRK
jgi:hypothetical protein